MNMILFSYLKGLLMLRFNFICLYDISFGEALDVL